MERGRMRVIPSKPIEAIEPDPRREGAVRIVVGGRAVLIVPVEAARREGLVAGAVLGAEQVERLLLASDHEAAFRTAVRFLERRPFARRDLGRRLAMKGHPPAAVEAALDRAEQAGYLDDERFARYFVQSRSARGRGPVRLRRELAICGVSSALADRVLAEEVPERAASEQVLALAQKRARQLRDLPRPDRIRRVVAYLARRGYRGPSVIQVVRQLP
jgi:regulatory protein